jgi:hypothetical protein
VKLVSGTITGHPDVPGRSQAGQEAEHATGTGTKKAYNQRTIAGCGLLGAVVALCYTTYHGSTHGAD